MSAPTLTFVGTATTVLRLGPFTILTDPNFLHQGQRAYLGHGLWSRRRTEPALRPAALPPLDAIVLSHLHGDHWDRVARRELDKELPVLTTPHAAHRMPSRHGFRNAVGLATGRSERLQRDDATLTVTAMPGRHARGPMQLLLPPVMGTRYELERAGEPPFRLYVSGDTLLDDDVRRVAAEQADLDAAVLHLGGTRILGQLVTMDAAEGAELLAALRAPRVVPIHFDDYPVFRSGLDEFRDEADRRGLSGRVRWVSRGDTVALGDGSVAPAS